LGPTYFSDSAASGHTHRSDQQAQSAFIICSLNRAGQRWFDFRFQRTSRVVPPPTLRRDYLLLQIDLLQSYCTTPLRLRPAELKDHQLAFSKLIPTLCRENSMELVLTEVAKVVLRDKYNEFTRTYEAFLADSDSIAADKELSRLVEAEEDEPSEPDDFLWAFAAARRCIGWIDWKGEYEEGQLKRLVEERMQSLAKINLDWKFLDDFEKSVDLNKLRSGDYITKKFTCIDQELRKKGVLLAMLQRGDDQYYPFLAFIEEFKTIDGAEVGVTTVNAWVDL
jgi:hypothetical protein